MSHCDMEGYVVQRHFQQYFRYMVSVSVIDGSNRSTRIKILSEFTDQLYRIKLYWGHHAINGIRTQNITCDMH
jgi:hypothetical protein